MNAEAVIKVCRRCGRNAPHGKRKRGCADLCRDCYNARSRERARCWVRSPEEPAHKSWRWMLVRCGLRKSSKPQGPTYVGITVCPEWVGPGGYAAFLRDMGPRPLGATLDRRDGSLGYFPANCRWVTMQVQQRNRRNNIRVQWEGRERLLIELAAEYRINYQTLHTRIIRNGWSVVDALTTPVTS